MTFLEWIGLLTMIAVGGLSLICIVLWILPDPKDLIRRAEQYKNDSDL